MYVISSLPVLLTVLLYVHIQRLFVFIAGFFVRHLHRSGKVTIEIPVLLFKLTSCTRKYLIGKDMDAYYYYAVATSVSNLQYLRSLHVKYAGDNTLPEIIALRRSRIVSDVRRRVVLLCGVDFNYVHPRKGASREKLFPDNILLKK